MSKIIKTLLFTLGMPLALLCACTPKEEPVPQAEVSLSSGMSATINADPAGGEYPLSFSTNRQWTIDVNKGASSDSWIQCTPKSGQSGNATAIVSVQKNVSGTKRMAVLTVNADGASTSVTVSQESMLTMEASDRTEKVGYEGGRVEFAYKSSVEVTVKADCDWIKTITTKAGDEHKAVFEVAENSGNARTGRVTFSCGSSTAVLTVEQAAFEAVFSLSKSSATVGAEGDVLSVDVTANIGYHFSTSVDWIKELGTKATSTKSHFFTIEKNTGTTSRVGVIVCCNDNEVCIPISVTQAAGEAILTISKSSLTFSGSDGSSTIDVSSNDSWTAESDSDWCTASPASGSGNGTISVKVSANSTISSRSASLTVRNSSGSISRTVSITQAAGEAALTLSKTSLSFSEAEGSDAVDISANDSWTAVSDEPWCTVAPGSGSGNGSIKVKVSENTSVSKRSAFVTVTVLSNKKTQILEVTQEAGKQTLSVSKSLLAFEAGPGASSFTVTSNGKWSVESDSSWCIVEPESGDGEKSVTVTVLPNSSVKQRSANVSVKCESSDLSKNVTISQSGATPQLGLSIESHEFSSSESSVAVNISANDDWTADSNASWCTVSPNAGNGTGSFTISAQENKTVAKRSAVITVRCLNNQLQKAISISQEAGAPYINLAAEEILLPCTASEVTTALISNTSWTATCDSDWCTVTPSSGSGDRALTVKAKENPAIQTRSAKLILVSSDGQCSKLVTVTQESQPQTISISKSTVSLGCAAESFTVQVTSNALWTAESNSSWCTLSAVSGKENGELTVSASENGNVVPRSAEVTFTTADGKVSRKLSVIQAAGKPVLELNVSTLSFTAAGGTSTIVIKSNADWTASLSSSAWCSLNTSEGTGDNAIQLKAEGNATVNSRTATLTVKTVDGSIVKTVSVSQDAGEETLSLTTSELSFGPGASGTNVGVISNTSWKVSSDSSWCTVKKGSTLASDFSVSVTANESGSVRKAIVTVQTETGKAEATVTVVQKPMSGNEGFGEQEEIGW